VEIAGPQAGNFLRFNGLDLFAPFLCNGALDKIFLNAGAFLLWRT
jgi:hypothetical protein